MLRPCECWQHVITRMQRMPGQMFFTWIEKSRKLAAFPRIKLVILESEIPVSLMILTDFTSVFFWLFYQPSVHSTFAPAAEYYIFTCVLRSLFHMGRRQARNELDLIWSSSHGEQILWTRLHGRRTVLPRTPDPVFVFEKFKTQVKDKDFTLLPFFVVLDSTCYVYH